MAEGVVITEEGFERLLVWLDPNREAAGLKYEKIRHRLIQIFTGRGCRDAEQLADETFDRVIKKVPAIADAYTGEPALYFYGVADKIHHEWLRKQKKIARLYSEKIEPSADIELETEYDCLESCLKKMPREQQQLIIRYYYHEKSAKIENRRQLASEFGISVNALQIKTSRIRAQIRDCFGKCLAAAKKKAQL